MKEKMKILGIVKETKNKWEQRVPLNPKAVEKLMQAGFEVPLSELERQVDLLEQFRP